MPVIPGVSSCSMDARSNLSGQPTFFDVQDEQAMRVNRIHGEAEFRVADQCDRAEITIPTTE